MTAARPGLRPTRPVTSAIKWSVAYRQPPQPEQLHRGLPSPWLTMVFSLADPFPIGVPAGGSVRETLFSAPVGGLHMAAVLLPQREGSTGIQLAVHPFAARALFGMPAGELGGQVVELGELVTRRDQGELRRLTELLRAAEPSTSTVNGGRMRDPRSVAAAMTSVHQWIDNRLIDESRPPPELREAWRLIIGSGGRMRVGRVAAEVGWSRRHLTTQFKVETGLGAKDLARVTRFDRAASMLKSPSPPNLATVAAHCGYADQSHLSVDWREFTGCTATHWLATERPTVGSHFHKTDSTASATLDA